MEGICDQAERVMLAMLWIVLTYLFSFFRPRHDLALEVLALRHQLMVLKRQSGRPKLGRSDRVMSKNPNEGNLLLFRRLTVQCAQWLPKKCSPPDQVESRLTA